MNYTAPTEGDAAMFQPAKLIEVLSVGQVPFIIVGGVAANLHGSARLTGDLDVVYDRLAGL